MSRDFSGEWIMKWASEREKIAQRTGAVRRRLFRVRTLFVLPGVEESEKERGENEKEVSWMRKATGCVVTQRSMGWLKMAFTAGMGFLDAFSDICVAIQVLLFGRGPGRHSGWVILALLPIDFLGIHVAGRPVEQRGGSVAPVKQALYGFLFSLLELVTVCVQVTVGREALVGSEFSLWISVGSTSFSILMKLAMWIGAVIKDRREKRQEREKMNEEKKKKTAASTGVEGEMKSNAECALLQGPSFSSPSSSSSSLSERGEVQGKEETEAFEDPEMQRCRHAAPSQSSGEEVEVEREGQGEEKGPPQSPSRSACSDLPAEGEERQEEEKNSQVLHFPTGGVRQENQMSLLESKEVREEQTADKEEREEEGEKEEARKEQNGEDSRGNQKNKGEVTKEQKEEEDMREEQKEDEGREEQKKEEAREEQKKEEAREEQKKEEAREEQTMEEKVKKEGGGARAVLVPSPSERCPSVGDQPPSVRHDALLPLSEEEEEALESAVERVTSDQ
uniref:Transmembrane protein n=1 Tax=Chromera velia CCMP2878 TaxID=1169474 RepID=A0A0G4H8U9_9ALVE|eukprot:Cvel_5917.t1-p1 / transcript=Cvel_5917.t1 / gene=Cvel_5917 / organism=Chromera_velia_CCMP2878 / gene_product=hypothetical protein / transcript_product=hypothetical protein / location=Cvel_scaffold283:32006-34233(-) / protein_length=505 / sequence_SO=supercontig / SO=protein_coding / is_pseudo=false